MPWRTDANLTLILFWTALSFLLGAMPFSVWIGKLILHNDIRHWGDGNPGAANAWRAGKWQVGVPALALDYLKGALPVGLAHFLFGVSGWGLVPVALAPVLGHAFSPFLGFEGGKALTVTFGIWSGVMLAEAPIMLGLLMALFLVVQTSDGWAVASAMLGLLAHLTLRGADTAVMLIWLGNMTVLVWKHCGELRQLPQPRPWLLKLVSRGH